MRPTNRNIATVLTVLCTLLLTAGRGLSDETITTILQPNGGSVGIGTGTPGQTLDVNGSVVIGSIHGTYPDFHRLTITPADGVTKLIANGQNNATRAAFEFIARKGDKTDAISSMLIDAEGNVGIGTTDPTERLHVNGKLRVGNMQFYDNEINRYDNSNLYIGYRNTANTILQRNGGNVGIGISDPQYTLTVEGTIAAREIIVTEDQWSDFVFDDDYELPTLSDVEDYIEQNRHLPDVPSDAEVKETGVNITDMQATLLQKIEELTLYAIEQQRGIKAQDKRISAMQSEIDRLCAAER